MAKDAGGYAVEGSSYCISHAPKMKDVKSQAVKKGEAAKAIKSSTLLLPHLILTIPLMLQRQTLSSYVGTYYYQFD